MSRWRSKLDAGFAHIASLTDTLHVTRLSALVEYLRSSLWFLPAVFGAAAVLLGGATLFIDRQLDVEGSALQFGGSAEGARSVLATIAQSMLTFTALVFTITMLVLQLASSQLSPRVMRTFLRDRGNQVVLGLFVATFVFTLVVLRDVRSAEAGTEFVPGLSIFVAFMLLLASVGAFIYYIDHMAHAIRAVAVIESIAKETRDAIDRLFPDPGGTPPDVALPFEVTSPSQSHATVASRSSGNIVTIDEAGLVARLRDAGTVARVVPLIGEYVPTGAPLVYVAGSVEDDLAEALRARVALGSERTLQQDAAYGFRQIVDIAIRALSPGTNDPTTAVQAIDRLHDLLRDLVQRPDQQAAWLDDDGQPRLIVGRRGWDDYLDLAVEEIMLSGSGQVQVMRRLHAMLQDLATVAPAERQPAIRRLLSELDGATATFAQRRS